jgi:hypothetical protein
LMSRQVHRTHLFGTAVLLVLLLPLAVRAQDFGPPLLPGAQATSLPDHARLLLAERGRPAVVTLLDGTRLTGTVGGADASGLVLMDGAGLMGSRMTLGWPGISSVRVERRNRILEGVLLGAAGGAALGWVSSYGPEGNRDILGTDVPRRALRGGSQGALIGALLGLLQGIDVHLPLAPVASGLSGPTFPGARVLRPTSGLVSLYPLDSLTLREIEASLQTFSTKTGLEEFRTVTTGQTWNNRAGATLALETGWPAGGRWWLRSRLEWTELPTVRLTVEPGGDTFSSESTTLSRDYRDLRVLVGPVLPIGGIARLPFAELSFLGGVSRTTLGTEYRYQSGVPGPLVDESTTTRQSVWRPVLMVGAGLSLLNRPTLSAALRLEGVMGLGFETDVLRNPDNQEVLLPRHRITPIGVHFGLEIRLPRF